ncbi:MAG: TlyA family rRNA (cytidine-2'-O)-methyltransferase [Thermoleophilia bacterium]|nr:MAG: TlyA family rRNA (cytidine-2'-O)-methyltransferase [Thermoleophilia bacterium]
MADRPARERLDQALVARGLAPTRSKAQAYVLAGLVAVDGEQARTAGQAVQVNTMITVQDLPRFVSRAGDKLDGFLSELAWDVTGADVLDIGASTGGFTDCLLQRGAARVVAVDVGYGQLDSKLRNDQRVTVMERTNARSLEVESLPFAPDLIVADVSFISLRHILGSAFACARAPWRAVVLVKPQFEASPGAVGKGGVVRETAIRQQAVASVARYALGLGAVPLMARDSGLPGPAGNHEYPLAIVSHNHPLAHDSDPDPERIAREAVDDV